VTGGALVAERLARHGLTLPPVAVPAGAYVPAVLDAGLVWTSGQLPFVDGALALTGLVGRDVTLEAAQALARTCALNALAAVGSVADLDEVERIVKVVGFVASADGFHEQPAVVNGASHLLGEIFGEAGRHARSAVGVAALPLGSPVELELVVRLRS
jgi:enamine deaminase RidA (YjgF/YER057c/UK114 family)